MIHEKMQDIGRKIMFKLSLEPVIFIFVFSNFVANGAQQNTNILLRKVCVDVVGWNGSVCQNHNEDPVLHLQVLRETNL